MVRRDQVFHPVFHPFDRAAQLQRSEWDQKVFRVELAANAKASPNVGFDEMDAVFGHLQQVGQHSPVEVGHFGLSPHGETLRAGVVRGYQTPGFQRIAGVPVAAELLSASVLGLLERCVDVAFSPRKLHGQVGAVLLEKKGVAPLRLERIHNRRKGVVTHFNRFQRVLGKVAAGRHKHRHRLADVAHLVARQRVLEETVQPSIDTPPHRDGPGFHRIKDVLKGEYGSDTGHFQGRAGVDGQYARMGVGAAQNGGV